jgi:CRP-like cAMP-binding protein
VLDGAVVPRKHRLGAGDLSLPLLGPGAWACLPEVLSKCPVQADYVALRDTTCLVFPAYNLGLLRAREGLDAWLLECLARSSSGLISWLGEGGPRERLLSWLLSRRYGPSGLERPAIVTTQAEIAACLGLARETVNKRLAELEARGLLKTARAEIRVPDWEALAQEASGDSA